MLVNESQERGRLGNEILENRGCRGKTKNWIQLAQYMVLLVRWSFAYMLLGNSVS
jgi:hypothetical protein